MLKGLGVGECKVGSVGRWVGGLVGWWVGGGGGEKKKRKAVSE